MGWHLLRVLVHGADAMYNLSLQDSVNWVPINHAQWCLDNGKIWIASIAFLLRFRCKRPSVISLTQ